VWRRTEAPPLENPGWPRFVAALEAEGVAVLDVGGWLAAMPYGDESPYLATDTHWTPHAMETVAGRLAGEIAARLGESGSAATRYERRQTRVEGVGDIERMLRLADGAGLFPRQVVTVSMVGGADGGPWRPDPAADVLLLGDSFTNVFSDASLHWGRGAGLAEQLSFVLRRPVDRIAVNAGGSNATRRALLDALRADPERLAGKRLVVYQFASRELSSGDWPVLRLP
jgi:alginate O-acetyltransferase complex protein AlgJ